MKYIIDEIELKQKINKLQGAYGHTLDLIEEDKLVEEILVDKKPVEMIASGEVVKDIHWDYWDIDNNEKQEFYNMANILKDYQGKSIKIYIEE